MAHINTSFFTWQVENKQFKEGVLWRNDSRIHRNIKIARDDSAVTLGCTDWCGLPLNSSERISEQALIFSLEGRLIYFLRFALLQWPKIAMWASCDGPQGDWSRSDIGMISVNFNSYASLVIIFLILVLFCFVFDHETLLTIRVLAVFDFYYCT